jgi:hypothetical protein
MPQIEVHKPFLLNLPDGSKLHFTAGSHNVEHQVSSHWWTLEHASVIEVEVETPVVDPAVDVPADEPVASAPAKSKRKSKAKPQEAPQQEAE